MIEQNIIERYSVLKNVFDKKTNKYKDPFRYNFSPRNDYRLMEAWVDMYFCALLSDIVYVAPSTPRQNVCACVNFGISGLHNFSWYHVYLTANFTKFDTNSLVYCCKKNL